MKARNLTRLVTTTLLALVLSGAALMSHVPSASALGTAANASVEYGNNNCGDPVLGAPVIGTVRFLRSGNSVMLRYVMTAADANTDYAVVLFDADNCSPMSRLGSFSTNAAGAGRLTSKWAAVGGATRFYAVAQDTSTFVGLPHGSLAVDLP